MIRGFARAFLLLLLCLAGTGIAQAQTSNPWAQEDDSIYTELAFIRGQPQGAFNKNLSTPGLGGAGAIGGRVPGLPFVLLTEVGLLSYNRRDRLELSRFQEQLEGVSLEFPLSTVSLKSNHYILTGHFVARLQPSIGRIEPYLDALLGLKYFFSNTRVEGDVAFERQGLEASANFDDLVLSYGAGGGVQVQLFKKPLGLDGRLTSVSINLGVRYLFGPVATYLGTESLRLTDRGLTFVPVRSRTDLLVPQVGIQLER